MASKKKLKRDIRRLEAALQDAERKREQFRIRFKMLKKDHEKLGNAAERVVEKTRKKVGNLSDVLGLTNLELAESKIEGTALKKRIVDLLQENREKEQRIVELQNQASEAPQVKGKAVGRAKVSGLATAQRQAWKRHQFLQDRFEFHVEHGLDKVQARLAANSDLVSKFGEEAGYSDDQLDGILM